MTLAPFSRANWKYLLLILIITVVDDVEEAESVDTLGGGDNTEPVTELVLLQELLGAVACALVSLFIHKFARGARFRNNVQVLEVATRELSVGDNDDLALTLLGDGDDIAEVTGAALDLDLVVKELLESGNIEDLVGGRLAAVDHELVRDLLLLSALGVLLK